MPIYLRQSTASQEVLLGRFLDSTDGNTQETGLTIANTDILLHKCGATTLSNKNSGGATHIAGGLYYAVLDATDTDTIGSLIISVHVAGALAVSRECIVLDEPIYDALIAGTDSLQIDLIQVAGVAVSAASAQLGVNVVSQANIDFGALQKASLNASTPASVVGSVGSVASFGTLVADIATAVWGAGTRTLSGFGSLVLDIWSSAIRTITDKTASELVAGYDAAKTAASQSSLDTLALNAAQQATLTSLGDAVALTSSQASVDLLPMVTDTLLSSVHGAGPWGAALVPTPGEIADAVWDESMADHLTAGSTGASLNGAGSAGDPWTTTLPGAYGAGTAGKIVGDNINAAISSRSSHSAADVWAVSTRTLSNFGSLVADVATAVWSAGTRTLSSFGTLAASVWDVATRTITGGASTQASVDAIASSVEALPTAAEIDSQLSGTHGEGEWGGSGTAPTAGEVANAVWDSELVDHVVAGTMGNAIGLSGDPLATAVPGTYAEGTAGYNLGYMSTATPGANQVTINTQLDDGTPIVEVEVLVLNEAGAVLKSGTTDANGQWVTAIDNGTYDVRLSKMMTNFTVPEVIVVNAVTEATFVGTPVVLSVGYGVQALIVVPTDSSSAFSSSAEIYANVLNLNSTSESRVINHSRVYGANNSTYFVLLLAQGVTYRIIGTDANGQFINDVITVTTDSYKNYSTY